MSTQYQPLMETAVWAMVSTPNHPYTAHLITGGLALVRKLMPRDPHPVPLDAPVHTIMQPCSMLSDSDHSTAMQLQHTPTIPTACSDQLTYPMLQSATWKHPCTTGQCSHAPSTIPTWQQQCGQ